VDGDAGISEIRNDVVLPRQHIRDFVLEPFAVSLSSGRTQEPLGTTRSETLHNVKDTKTAIIHSRTP
jgi:hypothetical protein